jgi:hypothetical protein
VFKSGRTGFVRGMKNRWNRRIANISEEEAIGEIVFIEEHLRATVLALQLFQRRRSEINRTGLKAGLLPDLLAKFEWKLREWSERLQRSLVKRILAEKSLVLGFRVGSFATFLLLLSPRSLVSGCDFGRRLVLTIRGC